MQFAINLMERGLIPEPLVRIGIRHLCRQRLCEERRKNCEAEAEAFMKFVELLRQSPVAVQPEKANEQHYELPAEFFSQVMGRRMKYSSCYWTPETTSLDEAESEMLGLTAHRAEIEEGMEILELGCGWGSFTLWVAEHFPKCKVLGVSNSHSQRDFILARAQERGLANVDIVTADMNAFTSNKRFDRVVSIEMFEHMRNYEVLMSRIASWLKPGGKLFVHMFTHRRFAYLYETEGASNWLGRYFFTGGTMPSDHLLLYFQRDLTLDRHWRVSGTHYQKTANAWATNLTRNRRAVMGTLTSVYGQGEALRWYNRWKTFFLACAELWGYAEGEEWFVSHYLFSRS